MVVIEEKITPILKDFPKYKVLDEVKERAKEGIVSLTPNEWFKAKRFKDEYFLYSVMNARTVPELYITKDPYNTLTADERKEIVRYIIPFDEIKNKGDVLK